ncbi:unnamed protein product [Mytilus edulis]|uniref:Tetraspanin n=1 Tax=Mytilus edulis TaxID=6550 RepID=A0A8S3SYR1_MYTED|nr:unnamed protein product [Mytilus edulis]
MGCCDGLSKCFLITFGILFLLFGGACLGGGIYVLVAKNDILILARSATDGAVDTIDAPSLIERAAHVLIAIEQMFTKDIRNYSWINDCFGSGGCNTGGSFQEQDGDIRKDNLQTMLNDNYIGPYASNAVSLAFDLAQILLDCCGVVNQTEYASITTWNTTYAYNSSGVYITANATIPLTCCQFNNKDAFPDEMTTFINSMVNNTCPVTQTGAHTTGCYEALKEEFSKYFNIMVGIAAGMGGLQIIGFISACCLMKEDRKTKDII